MAEGPSRGRARTFLTRLVGLGVIGLAAAIGLGWFGGVHPLLDLFSHFQLQYLMAGVIGLAVCCVLRAWRLVVVSVVLVVMSGARVVGYWSLPVVGGRVASAGIERGRGVGLDVMFINVLAPNTAYERVLAEVARHDPDVLVLAELTSAVHAGVGVLGQEYPHQVMALREDRFGIGVYSRHPLVDAEEFVAPGQWAPSIRCVVVVDGVDVEVIGTHPLPPPGFTMTRMRDAQLADIGEMVRGADRPVIVMGDLNATPWSHGYAELIEGTTLVNTRAGRGVMPSWPTMVPAAARIPIDHILVTSGIEVVGCELGGEVGSDHLPIVAGLMIFE